MSLFIGNFFGFPLNLKKQPINFVSTKKLFCIPELPHPVAWCHTKVFFSFSVYRLFLLLWFLFFVRFALNRLYVQIFFRLQDSCLQQPITLPFSLTCLIVSANKRPSIILIIIITATTVTGAC